MLWTAHSMQLQGTELQLRVVISSSSSHTHVHTDASHVIAATPDTLLTSDEASWQAALPSTYMMLLFLHSHIYILSDCIPRP